MLQIKDELDWDVFIHGCVTPYWSTIQSQQFKWMVNQKSQYTWTYMIIREMWIV